MTDWLRLTDTIQGDRVLLQSGLVADAGYETRWVDKDRLWRRGVELLIMRAQRPFRLTGGPFYVISLETLLAVRNWSP
jgi:hypothetical protein